MNKINIVFYFQSNARISCNTETDLILAKNTLLNRVGIPSLQGLKVHGLAQLQSNRIQNHPLHIEYTSAN